MGKAITLLLAYCSRQEEKVLPFPQRPWQIEELIRKGKLQKFVKKDVPEQSKHNTQTISNERPRGEDHPQDRPRDAIGEIRMINGGPTARGSFKSLKKS